MQIGIPKELAVDENRVALTPEAAQQLLKLGYTLSIESGAGERAGILDAEYSDANVAVVETAKTIWSDADIVLKVNQPTSEELKHVKSGQTLICFLAPAQQADLLKQLAEKNITALAVESIPRISRAQKMDALSSMANIAGYRAVIEAAQHFGRFFMGQITAAGKVIPAKVLVIGAGVAGLAAIGQAKAMGAIVRAFDTRPEVKQQVESMDAEFLLLDFAEDGAGSGGYAKTMSEEFIAAEMALFAEQAKEVDIIITTALIPGKPAPELITTDMVESMQQGSVIVDLAAANGGNCKLSQADNVIDHRGVKIIGYTNLPSRLPKQASQLYANNLRHLITDMTPNKDGNLVVDFNDEVIRSATVSKDGEVTFPPPPVKLAAAPVEPAKTAEPSEKENTDTNLETPEKTHKSSAAKFVSVVLSILATLAIGYFAPPSFLAHLTVFVLACFVGYMVIWNVTPSLHTPLMSVTNAISSIIIIGALLQISAPSAWVVALSSFAVLITAINIFGGFAVTRRMLAMFRK